MRALKTILSRLARITASPFAPTISLLLVSGEEAAQWAERTLGPAARVEVAHDRPSAALAADRGGFDAAVVDIDSADVWGIVADLRARMPVLALVRHESTGIKALLRGIDGVLNRASAERQQICGELQRAVAERRVPSCAPSCEAAEDARVIASRALDRVGVAVRDYAH